ncbi:MAG: hypothetical protein NWF14_02860 [Candidatus Bathyarchaeota archaeon]|nr:hypothetical protein [Candidatus Bathyarchaeota archaeon]
MSDDVDRYLNEPLWPILVETVHSIVMYPHHKAYVADRMLNEHPNIKPGTLAVELGISLGEALVILYEIKKER